MNRKNFGYIVQSLRYERTDEKCKPWTREYLSKLTGLSVKVLENIESGKKRNLTDIELIKIADAYKLTTMERREFYSAAIDIDDTKSKKSNPEAKKTYENTLLPLLEEIAFPAMVLNNYYDIVAVNTLVTFLFEIDVEKEKKRINENKIIPNILTVLLSNRNIKQTMNSDNLKKYLGVNIIHFRTASLRYRYTKRFVELYNVLIKNSYFKEVWDELLYYPKNQYQSADIMSFTHPKLGELNFMTKESVFLTNQCEFYLLIYVPLSKNTRKSFSKIVAMENNELITFPNWPDWKNMHYEISVV